MFKNANPIMPRWAMNLAGTPPMDAPFHDGAIAYLREAGLWTPASQQWQDRTLRRLQTLRAAWAEFLSGARSRNLSEAGFRDRLVRAPHRRDRHAELIDLPGTARPRAVPSTEPMP
jgi:hypothetical protein